jgi:hypothetical protein
MRNGKHPELGWAGWAGLAGLVLRLECEERCVGNAAMFGNTAVRPKRP